MAKSLGSNILKFTGKIGNVIAYYSRGKICYRSIPANYRDCKSTKQIKQRGQLVACTQFASKALDSLNKKILKRGSVEYTYLQLFNRLNMPAFNKEGEIEHYELLKFSCKLLPPPEKMEFTVLDSKRGVISVKWEDNTQYDSVDPNDCLRIIAINNEDVSIIPGLTASRKDHETTFQLPWENWDKLHLYAFFYNNSNLKSSPTFYQMIQLPAF